MRQQPQPEQTEPEIDKSLADKVLAAYWRERRRVRTVAVGGTGRDVSTPDMPKEQWQRTKRLMLERHKKASEQY